MWPEAASRPTPPWTAGRARPCGNFCGYTGSPPRREPDRDNNEGHNDCGPYRRSNPFRTTASRRIVGGVVELLVHLDSLSGSVAGSANQLLPVYRNTARTLSQSDALSCLRSAFDGDGWAALTGSDAGKLPIKPASSLAWVSRSARAASRGLAACLSCAAGLNLSAMLDLHRGVTHP